MSPVSQLPRWFVVLLLILTTIASQQAARAYVYLTSVDLRTAFAGGVPSSTINVTAGPYSFDLTATATNGGNLFELTGNPGIEGLGNTAGTSAAIDRTGDGLVFNISNFTGSPTGPPILLLTSFTTSDLDGPNAANNDGFNITGDFNYGVQYNWNTGPGDTDDQIFTPGTTPPNHTLVSGGFPTFTNEGQTGAVLGSIGSPNGGNLTFTGTSVGGQIWLLKEFTFAIVPEPSRAMLLCLGVSLCVLQRKRA